MDQALPPLNDELALGGDGSDGLVSLIRWTSSASRQLRRCLGQLAEAVSLTDGELLTIWLCVKSDGGLVQGELAAAVGVSPAQMSGIAERLRQRGLIEMHRQTLDRRRQVWRGTPAARQLLERLSAPLANLAAGINAHCSLGDQQAVRQFCQQLAIAMEAWSENSTGNASSNLSIGPTESSSRKAA